jgi:hypothetical protein
MFRSSLFFHVWVYNINQSLDDTFSCFQGSVTCTLQYKVQVALLFEPFEKPVLHHAQTQSKGCILLTEDIKQN